MSAVTVVWARQPLPTTPSVFLAGPTPAANTVPSWRPDAIQAIQAAWQGPGPLTVLTPESKHGVRAAHYTDQFDWEMTAREHATVILFWIPRDLRVLPGLTTNVEFGHDVTSGKAVLGCPPDCPDPDRNRYLIHLAHRYGVAVRDTLADTVAAALAMLTTTPAGHPAARASQHDGLPAIAAQIAHRLRDNGFPAQTAAQRQVLALAEEVGEFVGAYRRWSGQARRTGTEADMRAELADVVITAYVTAHELGLDLDEAITAKLAVVFTRGWREPTTPPRRPGGGEPE